MLDPERTACDAAGLSKLCGNRDFAGIEDKRAALIARDYNRVLLRVGEAELRLSLPVRVKDGDAAGLGGAFEWLVSAGFFCRVIL